MENEVDRASNLGVSLIALAAILVIVMATVSIGIKFKNNSLDSLDDVNSQVKTAPLVELSGSKVDMPLASAYQIITDSKDEIDYLYFYGSEFNGDRSKLDSILDDMGNNLKGRCKLEVEKQSNGIYNVKVHLDNCNDNSCSCFTE